MVDSDCNLYEGEVLVLYYPDLKNQVSLIGSFEIILKRVSQPPRLGEEDEIRVESKKGKVLELAREYREEVRLENNLTEK